MIRLFAIIGSLILLTQNANTLSLSDMSEEQAKQKIQEMIEDLKNDDEYYNAVYAVKYFFPRVNQYNSYLIGQLKQALDSIDWQQRQMAALALIQKKVEPFDRLCEVLVEALKHDRMPFWKSDEQVYRTFSNAHYACIYLNNHPDCGQQDLVEALTSNNQQQRFLAAMLLAVRGHSENRERIVEILLENMKNDQIRNNGKMAAVAIYKLNDKAKPYLPDIEQLQDLQQKQILKLIRREWNNNYTQETHDLLHKIGFRTFIKDEMQTQEFSKEYSFYGF